MNKRNSHKIPFHKRIIAEPTLIEYSHTVTLAAWESGRKYLKWGTKVMQNSKSIPRGASVFWERRLRALKETPTNSQSWILLHVTDSIFLAETSEVWRRWSSSASFEEVCGGIVRQEECTTGRMYTRRYYTVGGMCNGKNEQQEGMYSKWNIQYQGFAAGKTFSSRNEKTTRNVPQEWLYGCGWCTFQKENIASRTQLEG